MRSTLKLATLAIGLGPALIIGSIAQENAFLSLKEVPIPVPTAAIILEATGISGPGTDLDFRDLVASGIVRDQAALIRLGKALFWDMQVGSDGVQACATCHFNAGADSRSKNQISPGLKDQNFHKAPTGFSGDTTFGDSTVPFTANDPNTPNPPGVSEPPPNTPPHKLNVPGFPSFKPNHQLTAVDFPLNGWLRPTELTPRGPGTSFLDEFANVSRDTNDVISSQGVRHKLFTGVTPGSAVDQGTNAPDIFNLTNPGRLDARGRVRRVEPRNAPTVINAVFNFDNFWDGRASFIFNGVNPFGFRDRTSTLQKNIDGKLTEVFVRITNSSLASQAVGPAGSNFEMSWEGRTFPDVGKKLLSLKPLAKQFVHPEDSVLGTWSLAHLNAGGKPRGTRGLNVATYADMIKAAFQDQWWNSTDIITRGKGSVVMQRPSTNNPRSMARSHGTADTIQSAPDYARSNAVKTRAFPANMYTQIQWNFSLFWGLAVQAYEATLVSDDTPFDRFEGAPSKGIKGDPNALSASERNGLTIFMNSDSNLGGRCNNCHVAPVMTNHSITDIAPDSQGRPNDILEFMVMGDGTSASYDKGFYNIGVRRTSEDTGRAGTAPDEPPFRNPKNNDQPFPLSYVALADLAAKKRLPADVLRFIQLDPSTKEPVPVLGRHAINGNFKAPNLRNVRYTGPYFHNGDSATLRHVVEFYTRGGNFPNTNFNDLDPDVSGIPPLRFPEFSPSAEQNMRDLVNFVAHGLTDERVALEKGPFDHPQLSVPNGSPANKPGKDLLLEIPAVGRNGRTTSISTFLDLDPQARSANHAKQADHRQGSQNHKE